MRKVDEKSGLAYLEFQLDAFNPIMKNIESAGQAALNSKAQLLEEPPGVIALHTHSRELVC